MPIADIEKRVIDHLNSCHLPGVQRVGTEVPSGRSHITRYLVVRRAGGGGDALVSYPTVRISAYAESSTEAAKLIERAEAAMLALPAHDCLISHVEANSVYEASWAGTAERDGSPCYEALFELVANR